MSKSDERKEARYIAACILEGRCVKGGEHQWDGPEVTWVENGGICCSTTCSKCGIDQMSYDMARAP